MSSPLISVIMPVWNGEAHLREAIDSILNQTFRDFEFLILDDGSTDSTPAILAEYADQDPRIRIIPLDHQGIVIALNRGVDEARADWIARMDCDDIAHPERLERQWEALQAKPDAVLCHTQIHIFGEDAYVTPAARLIRSEAMLRLRLCYQCPIVHPTVMFRKDAFQIVGGYLAEERHAEDYSLWGRMIGRGSVVGITRPMLNFRVHASSISKQKADVQIPLSEAIALRHCRQFLHLDDRKVGRAWNALRYQSSGSGLRDWFWLLSHCLPRMEKQSLEMWLWAAHATVRRLLKSIAR
jgi:glycosyltransferase involved in cell wall biosynthesis